MNSCRLCGIQGASNNLCSIQRGSQHTLGALAMILFPQIMIRPGDGLSEIICEDCTNQLLSTYTFKIKCEAYDKYLRDFVSSQAKNHILKKEVVEVEYDEDTKTKLKAVLNPDTIETFSDGDDQNSSDEDFDNSIKHSSSTEEIDKSIDAERLPKKKEQGTARDENNRKTTNRKVRKSCIIIVQDDNLENHSVLNKSSRETDDTNFTNQDLDASKCQGKKFTSNLKLKTPQLVIRRSIKRKIPSPNIELIEWLKHNSKKGVKNPDVFHDPPPDQPSKPFMCDVCGNLFKNVQIMSQHKQTHLDVKLFSCSICNKKFSRNSHLGSHMRIHDNIKPYICETCGRSFIKSSDLTRHKRIHSDAKDYSCPLCSRRFKRSTDVTSHLRSHTGDRPYSCKCGKAYTSHSSLRKHRKLNCFGKMNINPTSEINSKSEEKE